jgi:tellurite methyltransferase
MKNKIQEWNEKWSARRDLEQDPNPMLVRVLKKMPPGNALDLACGIGRNALYLASKGWNVTAIDGSNVAIQILNKRAKKQQVEVDARAMDLESGKFKIEPGTFDLICMLFYLQRELLASARKSLKTGGFVIAAVHMKDDSPDLEPMNSAFLMEPGELKRAFEGWKIEHYLEGKSTDTNHERRTAEIIAQKP